MRPLMHGAANGYFEPRPTKVLPCSERLLFATIRYHGKLRRNTIFTTKSPEGRAP